MAVPVAESQLSVKIAGSGRQGGDDRRGPFDQIVQSRHFEPGGREAVEGGLDRWRAPREDHHGQDDPGEPGEGSLRRLRRLAMTAEEVRRPRDDSVAGPVSRLSGRARDTPLRWPPPRCPPARVRAASPSGTGGRQRSRPPPGPPARPRASPATLRRPTPARKGTMTENTGAGGPPVPRGHGDRGRSLPGAR
jgi:hypothetical protein